MINKVILLGRIGKKELKSSKGGASICKLSLATDRSYIDAQGKSTTKTTWHNVNLFSKLGDLAMKNAEIGALMYVEGYIVNTKIQDPDGTEKWLHCVTADYIKFLPRTGRVDEDGEPNGNIARPDSPHPFKTFYQPQDVDPF